MSLSILQNGPIPDFISGDILSAIFGLSVKNEPNKPLVYLCKGFDRLYCIKTHFSSKSSLCTNQKKASTYIRASVTAVWQ